MVERISQEKQFLALHNLEWSHFEVKVAKKLLHHLVRNGIILAL